MVVKNRFIDLLLHAKNHGVIYDNFFNFAKNTIFGTKTSLSFNKNPNA